MSESEPIGTSVSAASAAGGRHRAREVALQVLYAIDLAVDEEDATAEEPEEQRSEPDPRARGEAVFDRIAEHFVVPTNAIEFARELVAAVVDRVSEIDALLGIHAKNWRVTRMATVDRNVLRIAVYELKDTSTPMPVVIDEAVDLARRFGSDTSPSFVNGVLDAVAREVRV